VPALLAQVESQFTQLLDDFVSPRSASVFPLPPVEPIGPWGLLAMLMEAVNVQESPQKQPFALQNRRCYSLRNQKYGTHHSLRGSVLALFQTCDSRHPPERGSRSGSNQEFNA
jgi:hypothetical protein